MDQPANASIMVIGDDSHFCYLMHRYVREIEHQFLYANRGEDPLGLARREKPAVIVMQIDLPDASGWQTLRALKVDPATSVIPVVLCSWLDEEKRGLEEGADVYLRMPILYEDFRAALTRVGIRMKS